MMFSGRSPHEPLLPKGELGQLSTVCSGVIVSVNSICVKLSQNKKELFLSCPSSVDVIQCTCLYANNANTTVHL